MLSILHKATTARSHKKSKKTKKQKRKRRATLRKRTKSLLLRIKEYSMLDILDASPELLGEVDTHMSKCWTDTSHATNALKQLEYSKDRPRDLMIKRNAEGNIIFSRIVTRIPEANGVYVNYTCVSPEERSKGHYKTSLHVMRKYYEGTPYKYIFNQVETKSAGGMDHSTRLLVFHKLGFRLNPDYGIINGEESPPLVFRLKTGEIAEYISDKKGASLYTVRTATGKRDIGIEDIDHCVERQKIPTEIHLFDGSVRPVYGWGEGGRGYVTRNPDTGAEEIVYSEDALDVTYRPVEGDPYNASLYLDQYCPMRMPL